MTLSRDNAMCARIIVVAVSYGIIALDMSLWRTRSEWVLIAAWLCFVAGNLLLSWAHGRQEPRKRLTKVSGSGIARKSNMILLRLRKS